MIEKSLLNAGRASYKFYHGYNFNSLIELFKSKNYILRTFYQNNGVFKIWFINEIDPFKRIVITERNKYDTIVIFGFVTDDIYQENYSASRISNKTVFIDNYFVKENKLYLLKLNEIEIAIDLIEEFFQSNA